MESYLIAKLHDILKLSNDSKKHFCPEWCVNFSKLDDRIKKTLKHHCLTWYWTKAHTESCKPFLDRMSFCIHLADVKASTISRKLRTSKYQSFKTFKIWSDSATNRARGEIDLGQKNNDAEKIIDELINATDLASFYDKYKQDFITRSEDKARCPFASLHTHNELTALWFNFLFNNSDYFEIPEIISDIKDLRKTVHRVAGKRITLVRIRLATPGKLSRLRDVKLIKDIPDELKDICNGLKGEIIYELPEEILLVTKPEDADDVKSRIEKTLNGKTNYYCETSAVGTVMQNKSFLHNYEKIFGTYKSNYYPFLLTEIAPAGDNEASHRAIICDMCQMAPAQTVYPREAHQYSMMIEPVEEYLCDGCLRVRTEADRAKKLATWEDEKNASVSFFKISLDMRALIDILRKMFIDEFRIKKVFDEDLGFSILKEFLMDYEEFLNSFRGMVLRVGSYGDESNHEVILKNLFCIKIGKYSELKPLIQGYVDIFSDKRFFPRLIEYSCKYKTQLPIRLSVTCSNVKYPFMEHWQVLNNPVESINVFVVPRTRLEIGFEKFGYLRKVNLEDKKISSALHKLAVIEEKTNSEFLLMSSMLDMKNDLKELAQYLITTHQLTIKQTLAYYRIMKE